MLCVCLTVLTYYVCTKICRGKNRTLKGIRNTFLYLYCSTYHSILNIIQLFLTGLVNLKVQSHLPLNPQGLAQYMGSSLYSVNVY